MSTLSKFFVLFTLALSASSLATPHAARSPHDHHALAARVAIPEAAPAVAPYGDDVKVVKPKRIRRKRGDTNRCIAKSSSAVASSSSSTFSSSSPSFSSSSSTFSSSSVASPTTVAAVAGKPSSPSSTRAPKTTSSSSTPAPEATTPSSSSSKASSSKASPPSTTASTSGTQSFLTGTQTGQGTFYGIGLGACGVTNSGNDKIAAVSKLLFDQYPGYDGTNSNSNPVCGKSITATYQGKSTTVTVEDRCEACALTDLDFSPSAFDELASESVGRLSGMTWVWNN